MSSPKLLTFRSGGWVIVLTIALSILVVAMTVVPAIRRAADRPPGDGRDPTTYGFDLTNCLVPVEQIAAGQLHRDLVVSIDDPPQLAGSEVEAINKRRRRKFLVASDRVIGVEVNGESRAYPLVMLTVREVVNDTLGGRPIAVTYNPLCDSAVVFERPAGPDATPRRFGVSGLLYNSNLLLYDRAEAGAESLWSQLQMRAVSGPAAGTELQLVPAEVAHWNDWFKRHPATTVIEPESEWLTRYQETSYSSYFASSKLLFPVEPLPPAEGPLAKTPCVVVFTGGQSRAYPLSTIVARSGDDGRWEDTVGGTPLTFDVRQDPQVVRVTSGGVPVPVVYAFWFAWHAMNPSTQLVSGG